MKIIEALKSESVRLSTGYNWMVYDDQTRLWVVYSKPFGSKKTIVLYEGSDEEQAIERLLE